MALESLRQLGWDFAVLRLFSRRQLCDVIFRPPVFGCQNATASLRASWRFLGAFCEAISWRSDDP